MKTVAVTGGIGSGKSTVCSILSAHGFPVYEADSAAKRLYAKDDSLLDSIEEAFGCSIRLPDGALDTGKLAGMAFSSPEKLRILESIVHPAVLRDFLRWQALQATLHGDKRFCVIESAIILSKPEFLASVDKVVLVDAPLSIRLKRACDRDGAKPEEVIRRMSAQHFDLSKVDAILRNEGTLADLESEMERVFNALDLR